MKKCIAIQRSVRMFIGLCFLLTNLSVKGQSQQFSFTQYMDNLTPYNPTYSLLDKAGSIDLLARKQWVGIAGAPATFLFNGSVPLPGISSATGLTVLNDELGIEQQTEINAYFAKSIRLTENNYLAVSINAGIRNYVANYSSLDPSDPSFRDDVRQTKPNIGFGVMYYSDWYYLGVSVPELTITSLGTASIQNLDNYKNHYYFAGALITNISDDISFKPATLFSYSKGVPLIADFSGTFYLKNQLGFGLNYRTNNEMAGIFTVNWEALRIGYSYQFGTASNNLGGFNNSTHEVSISYRFGKGASNPKLL